MILSPEKIVKKRDQLQSDRKNWETHWQECADYIIPRKNNIIYSRTPGEKVNLYLLDNTAIQSNILLSGFLHGLLTNPNSKFFELSTGLPEVDGRDDVRMWLQDTSNRIMRVINSSNFQTEVHEMYLDLGCFGTACLSIEEDPQTVVRFASRPIQSIFVEEDSRGLINTMYREFEWNVSQIVGEFGADVVKKSRILQQAMKDSNTTKKYKIIHAVYPSEIGAEKTQAIFPYISQYILRQDQVELKRSGFREFPFVVPRWAKIPGEQYGRSPGMNALPEAKTLNLMVEVTLKGAQKVVDPPLQAPDDGFLGSIRTRPGAVNFYRSGSADRIEPIYNDARIDFGFESIAEKRARIRESFFVDQLKLREADRMTATEIDARVEEAFRFMGPVVGRMQSEFLAPSVDRVFSIMDQRGMIPPAPEILKDKDLKAQYSSLIARTQRQTDAKAILRTIEQATPFISADPSVLDNINGDQALKLLARINNFPQEILRSDRDVKKAREARAQQQAEAARTEDSQVTAENISKVAPGLAAIQGG